MPRTWNRWTPARAAAVLRDLDGSGLTLAEFARRRGLSVQRLRRWQDRLAPLAPPRLIELVPAAQVLPSEQQGTVRLRCPSGHVLELEDVQLVDGVATLLRALREVQ